MEVDVLVREIFAEQLGLKAEEILADSCIIKDLDADSLDFLELIMHFEEDFGLEISDKDAEGIKTVQDAINYVQEHK